MYKRQGVENTKSAIAANNEHYILSDNELFKRAKQNADDEVAEMCIRDRLYPADSFGAVSDSSGKVVLVNATLLPDFSDIIGNPVSYTHLKGCAGYHGY